MKTSYEQSAAKFDRDYSDINTTPEALRLMHVSMGLAGETGELVDAIKKHLMYNKALDVAHVKEECGDVLYYMALLLSSVGSSFEEVMELNIKKLSARYPNGYSNEAAIKRADKVG